MRLNNPSQPPWKNRFRLLTFLRRLLNFLRGEWKLLRTKEFRVRECILCKTWKPQTIEPGTIIPMCPKHAEFPYSSKEIRLLNLELKLLRREFDRKGGMVWTSDTKGYIQHATDERGFPKYPCKCPKCNLTGDRHQALPGKTPEEE